MDFQKLEAFYRQNIALNQGLFPEGFVDIAEVISHQEDYHQDFGSDVFANNFFIAELPDKITLFNSDFIVWLVPDLCDGEMMTRGYIALAKAQDQIIPEMAFQATGVYNCSGLILSALDILLQGISENQKLIEHLEDTASQDDKPESDSQSSA